MDRRFELVERRSESVDRQFAATAAILRRLEVGLGSLERGFEEAVRATVEEFAGLGPLRAERLVLQDTQGEVYGVRNREVEFDALVHDGRLSWWR